MFERLYRINVRHPLDDIRRVVAEARQTEAGHRVSFGTPPFKRDWLFRIRAVRLRFVRREPRA